MNRLPDQQFVEAFNAQAFELGWSTICDPSLAFERPELVRVCEIYRAAAAGRPMPKRSDMTPRRLKEFLPQIVIAERIAAQGARSRYQFRLAGSSYHPLFGDLTNRFLEEVLPPQVAVRWQAVLDMIVSLAAPMRLVGRSAIPGKEFLINEFFSAPLADDAGALSYVMGISYYWPELETMASSGIKLPAELARLG